MSALLTAIAGVPNAAEPVPDLVTGGQPDAAHLAALKAAGCAVVVDNRDPMEPRPIDEPAAVRAAGMEYVNVPVVHGSVTHETLSRLRDTMKQIAGRKVFMHCSSGNRTAGGMLAYLILDRGMGEEEATETAMGMGLRSAELMELALEYVRQQTA